MLVVKSLVLLMHAALRLNVCAPITSIDRMRRPSARFAPMSRPARGRTPTYAGIVSPRRLSSVLGRSPGPARPGVSGDRVGTMNISSAPIAGVSLIGGYVIARFTKNRPLGCALLAAGGGRGESMAQARDGRDRCAAWCLSRRL